MSASKFYNIPENEREIWNAHQKRLAEISRERAAMVREYRQDFRAMRASYGQTENIPDTEKERLSKNFIEKNAAVTEKENKEIARVMREFEAYDARKRAPEAPAQQRGRDIDRER